MTSRSQAQQNETRCWNCEQQFMQPEGYCSNCYVDRTVRGVFENLEPGVLSSAMGELGFAWDAEGGRWIRSNPA